MSLMIAWMFLGIVVGTFTGLWATDRKDYSGSAGVVIGFVGFLLVPITILGWICYGAYHLFLVLRTGVRDLRALWFPAKVELPKAKVIREMRDDEEWGGEVVLVSAFWLPVLVLALLVWGRMTLDEMLSPRDDR